MAESKGHNLVITSQNSLKSKSGYLNIDPNLYVKYQNPSSKGSYDIVLTRFLYCYNGRFEKGAQSSQYFMELAPKLIRSSKYCMPNLYAKYQNPSSRGSYDIMLTSFCYSYNGRVEKGA